MVWKLGVGLGSVVHIHSAGVRLGLIQSRRVLSRSSSGGVLLGPSGASCSHTSEASPLSGGVVKPCGGARLGARL
ncbi:hypothetical protein E2C01_052019 [Portunus trituberculatus]|uniref:Uncharacterized protein n=1 Tax=Portunus trituberculatus TaxID=210409 RepID=A0A5B7GL85_PORTR|nr:hypothetical protein [Portunus trituberculatus]